MCGLLGNIAMAKDETLTYSDGSIYVGQTKDGKPNGQGTYTWPDGRKYVGQFNDGKVNGQGTLYDNKGKVIEKGTYRDGKLIGK